MAYPQPTDFSLIDSSHERGEYSYARGHDVSAFCDMAYEPGREYLYVWRGSWDDHDIADHTALHTTLEGAVAALEDMEAGRELETDR